MDFRVIRDTFTEQATTGSLFAGSTFLAYTLEDRIRAAGVKVPGQTAIPPGRYKVVIDFSQRFQRMLPHVLDVPMFTGIRWHPGNVAADTEGCLLTGRSRGLNKVFESKAAFEPVLEALQDALRTGPVWVTYENKNPPSQLLVP